MRDWTALETAAAIRARKVSVTEVVTAALDRLSASDPVVGAFATPTPDMALQTARLLDASLPTRGSVPALYGVPTTIKDFVDVAGVRTGWGSAAMAAHVAAKDDHTTIALRDAGLVSLGKSNVPELGLTCFTEPRVGRIARSPWDLDRGAAGSSGGAAAAVASRIVPVAQGSDSGGSIRSPAAVCGLVGLKTSRGRVSFGPNASDGFGLSVRGPLARTVADAAAFLDVLARRFPGDVVAPPCESFTRALTADCPQVRVALYDTGITGEVADAPCRRAAAAVADMLSQLGHHVERVPAPVGEAFAHAFVPVFAGLAAAVPLPDSVEQTLEPFTRSLRALARTGPPFPAALSSLNLAARAGVASTADYDVVLSPTLGELPAPHGSLGDDDAETCLLKMARFSAFTAFDNVTGRPAINVPVVWSDDGLPIGVQLVAAWGSETTLLQIARQLELLAPWHERTPPMLMDTGPDRA